MDIGRFVRYAQATPRMKLTFSLAHVVAYALIRFVDAAMAANNSTRWVHFRYHSNQQIRLGRRQFWRGTAVQELRSSGSISRISQTRPVGAGREGRHHLGGGCGGQWRCQASAQSEHLPVVGQVHCYETRPPVMVDTDSPRRNYPAEVRSIFAPKAEGDTFCSARRVCLRTDFGLSQRRATRNPAFSGTGGSPHR